MGSRFSSTKRMWHTEYIRLRQPICVPKCKYRVGYVVQRKADESTKTLIKLT